MVKLHVDLTGTHPRSFPHNTSGFWRSWTEFVEAQSFGSGWECCITEQLPAAQTFTSQTLKVLVQVLHGIGVRPKASRQGSLLGECWCHAGHFINFSPCFSTAVKCDSEIFLLVRLHPLLPLGQAWSKPLILGAVHTRTGFLRSFLRSFAFKNSWTQSLKVAECRTPHGGFTKLILTSRVYRGSGRAFRLHFFWFIGYLRPPCWGNKTNLFWSPTQVKPVCWLVLQGFWSLFRWSGC